MSVHAGVYMCMCVSVCVCVHACVSVCVCVQGWGELRQGSGKQKSTSRGQGPPRMEARKATQAPRAVLTPRGSPCPRVPQPPRKSTEDLGGLWVSQGACAEPAPICSGLLCLRSASTGWLLGKDVPQWGVSLQDRPLICVRGSVGCTRQGTLRSPEELLEAGFLSCPGTATP